MHICPGEPITGLLTCRYCSRAWTLKEECSSHERLCPARPGEAKQLAQCAQCKSWVVNNKGTKSKHINNCTGKYANPTSHRFTCPTCAANFSRLQLQKIHINNGCPGLHPDATVFFDTIACQRCWEGFTTLTECRVHEECQHTKNEKDAFRCKLCSRGLSNEALARQYPHDYMWRVVARQEQAPVRKVRPGLL